MRGRQTFGRDRYPRPTLLFEQDLKSEQLHGARN